MSRKGPPPKRDSQRRRQNKPDTPVETATSDGGVRGPKLVGNHSAPAKRWYEALQRSGQAQFFEPSDWAAAELVVLAIDKFVKSGSAMMLGAIEKMSANLLVTEGDRRRLRLELERPAPAQGQEGADVAWIDDARNRLRGAQ